MLSAPVPSASVRVPLDLSGRGKHVASSVDGSPACSVKYEFPSTTSAQDVLCGILQSRLATALAESTSHAAGEEPHAQPLVAEWPPERVAMLGFQNTFDASRLRGLSSAECDAQAALRSAEAAAAERPTLENTTAVSAAAAQLDFAKKAADEKAVAERVSPPPTLTQNPSPNPSPNPNPNPSSNPSP